MNEKPLHLPMSFGEALARLVRVPNKKSKNQATIKKAGAKTPRPASRKTSRST